MSEVEVYIRVLMYGEERGVIGAVVEVWSDKVTNLVI